MTTNMSNTSGDLKIGSGNNTLWTQVDMKNVAIYKKVLTQEEASNYLMKKYNL